MLSFENEKTTWMGISDLMAALMMVFLFISVAFIFELQNAKKSYQDELNRALYVEFENNLNDWSAIITDDNIIRFDAPFKIGSASLEAEFTEILEEFFPRYVRLLSQQRFKSKIAEIRIEGHTSDSWGHDTPSSQIYLNNMRLSQQRASNVLEYVYSLDQGDVHSNIKWLEQKLRGNGMAFSQPIYTSLAEVSIDPVRSRRVEFKAITYE